jgi:hypothetical protein
MHGGIGTGATRLSHVDNRSVLAVRQRSGLLGRTAKTDEDGQSLPAHALTWTQTALEEERQCTAFECPQLAWRGSLFVEAE